MSPAEHLLRAHSAKIRLRSAARRLAPVVLRLSQRFGIDILPRHFYSEVPDIRALENEQHWRRPLPLDGLDAAVQPQLDFVTSLLSDSVVAALSQRDIWAEACFTNNHIGYGNVESKLLYAYIRSKQPSRIIQVGAGVSTAVILAAIADDPYPCEINCVDPFPNAYLRGAADSGSILLTATPVQHLQSSYFRTLDEGDLLFIDSTHTLGPAGEVTRLVLETLPSLRSGVVVHFHDIWLPFDYNPRLFDETFFWHETALLLAFLHGNDRFQILFSQSFLHHFGGELFAAMVPGYSPAQMKDGLIVGAGDFPSAIFLALT